MSYINDSDLDFLSKCSDEDLGDLVYVLTHDKDGEPREFTGDLISSEVYKTHFPHHHMYWREMAAEIQCYGANTFVTLLRGGQGVLYKEVLCDVCDKFDVNYNKKSTAERIELQLLAKVLEKALEEMSPADIKKVAEELGVNNISTITAQSLTGGVITIFNMGGFQSYKMAVTLANTIFKAIFGRGLTIAGNCVLTRSLSLITGPIGWVLMALWTAIDLAGPAYRVTIPAVITVAALRQKALHS